MNYELAKQLKDTGFRYDIYLYDDFKEVGNAPTLSELIEACGLKFYSLTNNLDRKWTVMHDDRNEYIGSTPEEAVARLWLAINKK